MIGIFDSGVGGLSIYLELKKIAPQLSVVYFADSANFPYGEKSQEQLLALSVAATERLIEYGATTIVVACNSATVSTITDLRERYPQLNFVGVEPAIKVATEQLRSRHIGLLATKKTVVTHDSDSLADGGKVYRHWNSALIDMIETRYVQITHEDLSRAVDPLVQQGVDTIVLGCTHFYFVKARFESEFLGLKFVEAAQAVAARTLEIGTTDSENKEIFLVSGDLTRFTDFMENVVGYKHADIRKV